MTRLQSIFFTNRRSLSCIGLIGLLVSGLAPASLSAATSQPDVPPTPTETQYFQIRFKESRKQHLENPNDGARAMAYARAAFDWADFSDGDKSRAQIARPAIQVCRRFLEAPEHAAEAHYYLALNLGQLARTQWLGALKIVREMEERLLTAQQLNPKLDHAGVYRALGRLYFRAPRWPTSIGNRKKAETQLRQAIQHAPKYPGNHLFLVEMLIDRNKLKAARTAAQAYVELVPTARQELSDDYWQLSWREWDHRWLQAQAALK